MASPGSSTAQAADELTPAQRLMQQHTAAHGHHQPTVEEVVDEEDIAHPPPAQAAQVTNTATMSNTPANGQPMSAKAAGKQRATESPVPKAPALDTQSEEAFPSLGVPKAKPAAASAWGRKPASVAGGQPNGAATRSNGNAFATNGASSGTSTPASGIHTPATGFQSPPHKARAPMPTMNIPGRYTETMKMPNDSIRNANDLPKGVPEILRDIERKNNVKIERFRVDKHEVFTGRGTGQEPVQQALKEVAAAIGLQQKISVPIPASVRPYIIGKGGSTIQSISKRTGAKVNMDRGDNIDPNDEDAVVDVHIEGNPMAVTMAQQAIETIVGQRVGGLNTRIKHIPPELFPFLAGAHNQRLKTLEQEKDVRIKMPDYHTWNGQPPEEAPSGSRGLQLAKPQDGYHIQIQGDREAARQIQTQLEAEAKELERTLTLGKVQIEKDRHGFILGDRGVSQHDFLKETGCSVILPPSSEDTEMVLIIGPQDQIESGVNKAMDLAAAMSVANVDIARQHQSVMKGYQNYTRDLTRYLRQRRALEQFEKLYDSHVIFPPSMDKATAWQVYSREAKNAMKARSDILNLVSGHPPARFRNVDMHPFYHRHVTPSQARIIRDQHGVHVVVPEDNEEIPQILLVYEGTTAPEQYEFPRKQPSSAEAANFENALREAENFILALIGEQQQIVQHSVEAPIKYREKVQKYLTREQREQNEQFPVQMVGMDAPAPISGNSFPVEFRGPSTAVDEFAKKIQEFLAEQVRDEAERDYTVSFDFPQKFANFLIGKRGENINKLRDEFDVEIQVSDGKVDIGKVDIKGPKAKADAAKAHILALGRKLEDETTHALKINPQFHREIIGRSGAQIKRLEERYNVRINFPRSAAADDGSVVDDGASEAGGAGKRRAPTQAADEVIIKGPRKGADEARDEVFNLYKYYQENSFTATVSVAQSQLPSLIGQGGRELESLRLATKADIDIPSKEAVSPSGRVEVKIKGTKAAVEAAKKLIEGKAKLFDDTATKTVKVDKAHHRALIGREGENIRQIIVAAGAVGEPRELSRMVQFPKADSSDDSIRVEGPQQIVDRIVAAIESFVKLRDSQVTESVEVAPEKHGALIGRRGETKKSIETEHKVTISIPNTTVTGPARSLIKITGLPADVEKAKERVLGMVKSQESESLSIPIRFHHAIADTNNGAFFRNLSRNLQVTVDHAGHSKPPRPTAAAPPTRSAANAAALPLITDDQSGDQPELDLEKSHDWNIVAPPEAPESGEDLTIPWILKGASADNIAQAKAQIEAALAEAQSSVTGYLVLPDPKLHRFVIGQGGATVNAIRMETGCKIDVPKSGGGGSGEAIIVRGPAANVEEAKKMILKAVKEGNSNAAAGGGRMRR